MNLSFFGAGAWGTALACHAATRHRVCLWVRDPSQLRAMRATGENRRYLPGVGLPAALELKL